MYVPSKDSESESLEDICLHEYNTTAAQAYKESRHGIDGAEFLDPFVDYYLKTYAREAIVVDVGTGAAPVSIEAVHAGAKHVYGIDISPDMIAKAAEAVTAAGLTNWITIEQGDATGLWFSDSFADLVISVNVACNLPSQGEDVQNLSDFVKHFKEMSRIIKLDGKVIVAAPTNFGEVFTAGKKSKSEVLADIASILIKLRERSTDTAEKLTQLKKEIGKLEDVNRATFVQRNHQFVLIYDGEHAPTEMKENGLVMSEANLQEGEIVWRKLAGSETTTGLTVLNFYHPLEEYLRAIERAGLRIVGIIHEIIHDAKEKQEYDESLPPHRRLGLEYGGGTKIGKSPFDVYLLEKRV